MIPRRGVQMWIPVRLGICETCLFVYWPPVLTRMETHESRDSAITVLSPRHVAGFLIKIRWNELNTLHKASTTITSTVQMWTTEAQRGQATETRLHSQEAPELPSDHSAHMTLRATISIASHQAVLKLLRFLFI